MTSRNSKEFKSDFRRWFTPLAALLLFAVCMGGCEGEQGPAGPAGPAGGTNDFQIEFLGGHPVLPADGASSMTLEAHVTTLGGNNVEGYSVKFALVSGNGIVSPGSAVTDFQGRASCVFTTGQVPGDVLVSASIEVSGITITDVANLYLDPLSVGGPLLTREFAEPLMASWSHDGSFVVFQTQQYNDFNLFKVNGQGGEPVHLGNYRGGSCNPDGSERIAVFGPESGGWPEDSQVFILDYDGMQIGTGFRPDAFSGAIRGVLWCQDGDSLLVASSTNGIMGVSGPQGEAFRRLDLVLWASSLSAVPGSPLVAATGGSQELSGLFRIDLDSDDQMQIVSSMGLSIAGASVDPLGTSVVYSGTKDYVEDTWVNYDLFSVPFSGGEPVVFFASPVEEMYPAWSPDGRKIVFCSNRSGSGYNLYVYTVPQ